MFDKSRGLSFMYTVLNITYGGPLVSRTLGVLHCGLGAFIKVLCQNTLCRHIKTVSTGKRHGRIWDANTKLAAGTAV